MKTNMNSFPSSCGLFARVKVFFYLNNCPVYNKRNIKLTTIPRFMEAIFNVNFHFYD